MHCWCMHNIRVLLRFCQRIMVRIKNRRLDKTFFIYYSKLALCPREGQLLQCILKKEGNFLIMSTQWDLILLMNSSYNIYNKYNSKNDDCNRSIGQWWVAKEYKACAPYKACLSTVCIRSGEKYVMCVRSVSHGSVLKLHVSNV